MTKRKALLILLSTATMLGSLVMAILTLTYWSEACAWWMVGLLTVSHLSYRFLPTS